MPRFSLLLLTLALLTPTSTHAARIYSLIDYPDLQNGHSLRGTITTTDEAPDDGLLKVEEILDWEWEISGPNNLSATFNSLPPFESETAIQSVNISAAVIELPRVDNSMLSLSQRAIAGRGLTIYNLVWFTRFDDSTNMILQESAGGLSGGDFFSLFWRTPFENLDNSSLVIAKVVPEPSSATLTAFVALSGLFSRR